MKYHTSLRIGSIARAYGVPHSIIESVAEQVIHRSDNTASPSPITKRAQPAKTAPRKSGQRPHNKPCDRRSRSLTGNRVMVVPRRQGTQFRGLRIPCKH
jgi:hypothetical protein